MTQTQDSTHASTTSPAADHAHGDEAHSHNPHLAHHFDTPRQQMETGKLGMWVFLATEILMFGGLFCAYAVYRANNPDIFLYGHNFLDTKWGAFNTVVLIASSFTMAWAVRASQLGQKKLLVTLLGLTLLGGVGFMVIKGIEYNAKFSSNLGPGTNNAYYPAERNPLYQQPVEGEPEGATPASRQLAKIAYLEHHYFHTDAEGHHEDVVPASEAHAAEGGAVRGDAPAPAVDQSALAAASPSVDGVQSWVLDAQAPAGDDAHGTVRYADLKPLDQSRVHMFFQVYFLMTGLHGIHVLIGMGLITYLFVRAIGGAFGPKYFAPVDLIGLYWHLVDLIWIFLFPLLYLIH